MTVEITDSSALVVAHPDDEALWFSSVLANAGKIIICFGDVPSRPDWSEGRRRSLAAYPLASVVGLGLTESEVLNGATWPNPVASPYGLVVSKAQDSLAGFSESRYERNFEQLKGALRVQLKDCRNVFTHNPWGEYGHEEHVQVFRAVESLQTELGFKLWCSNYFSDKNHGFMVENLPNLIAERHSLRTNLELAQELKSLYQRDDCWTWSDGYRYPDSESFLLWNRGTVAKSESLSAVPMNFVQVGYSTAKPRTSRLLTALGKLGGGLKKKSAKRNWI
jgi:LmbE family N-acetylglucosaminyl deacetylase